MEVDEILEDDTIDTGAERFLALSFRLFGLLGNPKDGKSLLACLTETHFRGSRGLKRLFTYAWRLQRSVGSKDLTEKDRTLFSVAYASLQKVIGSSQAGTRRRRKAEGIGEHRMSFT